MTAFTVDWRGELSYRGADSRLLPTGRMSFGTRNAGWLEPFSGPGRELVLVASTVRQADRLVKRSASTADSCWGRSLELTVPVKNVARWKRVTAELEELLQWLTDDSWRLQFVKNEDAAAVQQNLFDDQPVPNASAIALFSGGLDSVAGTDAWLAREVPTYLFSVSGDNVHAKHAAASAKMLEGLHPGKLSLLAATHQLRKAKVFEKSQRTRGFFFFALAAAAAHALDLRRLVTFEAGVGALNLPMNAAQTGAENTRAMHPKTLLLAQAVFNRLFDSEFSVEAPFLYATKGELCGSVTSDLAQLARASYSCDEPQARKPRPFEHCGFCTSCLFRRSALHAVLGRKDPTQYRGSPRGSEGAYERDAFCDQAHRFGEWTSIDDVFAYSPDARFARTFAKQSVDHCKRGDDELVKLFNRHGAEATAMLSDLAPTRSAHNARSRQETHHAVG